MKKHQRNLSAIILCLIALALAILYHRFYPTPLPDPITWVVFILLLAYTTSYGIPIGVGEVSLFPMVAFSATIAIGPAATAIAVVISDSFYGFYRWLRPGADKWERAEKGFSLLATTAANITMHLVSALTAGMIYFRLGGSIPATSFRAVLILFSAGAIYVLTNYLLAALFLLMRSQAHLQHLLNNLRTMLAYEALPMVFAPLMASILQEMGLLPFLIFAFSLLLSSIVLKNQAEGQNRLKRNIQELKGLQSIGQSLSASLEEKQIAEAVYREVSKLMPANNFYLALYNPQNDEVRFPVYYEHNQKIINAARIAGKGLTEHILRAKQSLLIEKDVRETIESMGVTQIGQEALSWIGVPILIGDEALGMIAVQSYPVANQLPQTLDAQDLAILEMIAAQSAIALQNARLYAQTDQALAQRVQELNSILTTTSEGIALLNADGVILEVNRALCMLLDTFPSNLIGRQVDPSEPEPFGQLKIPSEVFDKMVQGDNDQHEDETILEGKRSTPVMRTITPVRNAEGKADGWLFVFRDLTEERNTAEFRDNLTRMLIHDLRSPVVSIQGGLDMIEILLDDGDKAGLMEMVNISRKGSSQILGMINELLNLNKLETGQIVLQQEPIDIQTLIHEELTSFRSLLQQAGISVEESFSRDLTLIHGDSGLLRRTFHNVLDNAIKFTPDKGAINIWAWPDPLDKDYVLTGFKDAGPGIAPAKLGQLFTKYFTDVSTGSRRKGTGLGLHFCKLAVEAHQGTIWAESEPGNGCEIFIRLPLKARE